MEGWPAARDIVWPLVICSQMALIGLAKTRGELLLDDLVHLALSLPYLPIQIVLLYDLMALLIHKKLGGGEY
eukprot:2595454-Ditylum_brightwellii.AAC.1